MDNGKINATVETSIPNHGNNRRKEQQMIAITRTMSVAVFITLGLALAVGAAESADSGALPRAVDLQPLLERHWQDHFKDLEAQLAELGPSAKDANRLRVIAASGSPAAHALIWPEDRRPVDVLLRRTAALLEHLRGLPGAPMEELTACGRELAALQRTASGPAGDDPAFFRQVCVVQRRIALANPLLDAEALLFTGYCGENIIQGHQISTTGRAGAGAGLYRLDGLRNARPVLSDVLADRTVGDGPLSGRRLTNGDWAGRALFYAMDLDYDGRRLVFTWAQRSANDLNDKKEGVDLASLSKDEIAYMRAYRMAREGAPNVVISAAHARHWGSAEGGMGLTHARSWQLYSLDLAAPQGPIRQLTGPSVYSHYHPCWMPDGRIVSISDSLHHMERCGGMRISGNLFSMRSDGSDRHPLSWHETNEWLPSVGHDGMLVYTRWDYIDRQFADVHSFWTCYPDGRDPRAPHGNYGGSAVSELGIKSIPGAPGRFMAIGGGHHADHSGNLIMIDIHRPDRSPGNLDYFWPSAQRIGDGWSYKLRHVRQRAFWSEITPLSDLFVVGPEGTRILLVDRFGTETLLFDAREVLGTMAGRCQMNNRAPFPLDGPQGDFLPVRYPTLVRQRPRPPVIPVQTYQGARRSDAPPATVAVMNVYDSDFTWPPGTKITALRIIQVLPKSWPWTMGINNAPVGWSSGAIARMPLGTVPVEADGSAYFEAPIERLIYFQALNADGLAVQSMRSGTYVHPGERLSCAGCHEDKWKQRAPTTAPLALRRPPSQIAPEVGGVEPVNYWRLAKPVFDAKCTGCHVERGKGIRFDYYLFEKPSNKRVFNLPLLERVVVFSAAWDGGTAGPLGAGNRHRTVAGRFGAMGSPLLKHLDPSHHGVQLTAEERRRITLWIDCNAVALGSYDHTPAVVGRQIAGERVWPMTYVNPDNPMGLQRAADAAPYFFPPLYPIRPPVDIRTSAPDPTRNQVLTGRP